MDQSFPAQEITEEQWREVLASLEKSRDAVEKAFFCLDQMSSPDVFNKLKGSMAELTRNIERVKLMLEVICPNANNDHLFRNPIKTVATEMDQSNQKLISLTPRAC